MNNVIRFFFTTAVVTIFCVNTSAQNKFFIDGYHGGFWGHYPSGYTGFIADKLDENDFWKINLEIEPVTWDVAKKNDFLNYSRLKQYVKDQSTNGRIEFVNPSYGQSYLFNLQGESVIRQFEIGIKKVLEHFPEARFQTYSSEEPCFTSALPQILKSFGYSYASLKNPNTCWGGYTRAFGGELVNWKGSDGSVLLTVPRYQTESLLPNSTWQTIAWNNSPKYISSAFEYGVQNPIGMCIQDAGWKNGPWLGKPNDFSYKLWADYIKNTTDKSAITTWNFDQEDVQVSLVWGAQILQQMAQKTRTAENKLIMDEKIDAIKSIRNKTVFTDAKFDGAWQNLLLAQHHDSWIVPYNIVNKGKRWNWAEQVAYWTENSNRIADSVANFREIKAIDKPTSLTIYNTLAQKRKQVVSVLISKDLENAIVTDGSGKKRTTQMVNENGQLTLLFEADVPAMGSAIFEVKNGKVKQSSAAHHVVVDKNKYRVETENFNVVFDASKGGVITSLIAKKLDNKQYVDLKSDKYFNEMRGFFYKDSTFYSSKDQPAKITVVADGALQTKVKIEGKIGFHPFTQYVTFTTGDDDIDVRCNMDWQDSAGIGQDYAQAKGWKANDLKKAFYIDSLKLLAVFPLNLSQQKVYKNSAFDVMESRLKNTYFNTWDSIKNNIIVNWVDVTTNDNEYGLALMNDHTTSYAHGEDGALGLTLQYAGMGLWGRNYTLKGSSKYHYALIPHRNKWDKADIWNKSVAWNEPFQVTATNPSHKAGSSIVEIDQAGYEISSVTKVDGAILFRVFNSSSASPNVNVTLKIAAKRAELVELNGKKSSDIKLVKKSDGIMVANVHIQQFGLRTIKVYL